jgi:hypothetical protein
MAKSSINFQKAKGHSLEHNFRKDKPNYLLPEEFQLENEFWNHEKSEQEIFTDELSKAKRKGGRKPKLENSRWEAVLNLNKNHTLEDVKKVAKHIEEKFNITCSAIAIHRDEGFVENYKPHYNFHAHINFVTYKDGRQNWRKEHIKPAMLSELQTEVAELLQMERGQINSKAERLSHKQYKQKAKELAKQKDLKAEIARLRTELKEQGAVREDYARMEQLNRKLKQQIKNKDLTITELQEKLKAPKIGAKTNDDKLLKMADKAAELIRTEKDAHKETQKQLSEARETILKQKATIDTQKELIERLRANISDLEHKNKVLKDELKTYRGKDRQIKRRKVKVNDDKIKEAKQQLKSVKTDISSPLLAERSEINIREVEQFMQKNEGTSSHKIAKKYLRLTEELSEAKKECEAYKKHNMLEDLKEAQEYKQILKQELAEQKQKLLEAGFKPAQKNEVFEFKYESENTQENSYDDDDFPAP